MSEKFKILAQFIKDMSSETPSVDTYLYVKDIIAKYNLKILINSQAIKNNLIEVCTKLTYEDPDLGAEKKAYFELVYASVIKVNKEVQEYTTRLQSDVQTMQGTVANNQALLTKYQAETVEYQAEVAAETQEQSVKMQQYQLLYTQLKAEYDAAFMIAAPKQQPQQQVRA